MMQTRKSPARRHRDPDSRSRPNRETGASGRIGNRGFPDSRFPAGIPDSRRESPIPGQIGNRGNGNWGFPGLPVAATQPGLSRTSSQAAMWDHHDGVCHCQILSYRDCESAAITAPVCPSHYATIQGASLLLLHCGFGLQPLALQLSARLPQMGHFLSLASGLPGTSTGMVTREGPGFRPSNIHTVGVRVCVACASNAE
jgi:hypothetical protein